MKIIIEDRLELNSTYDFVKENYEVTKKLELEKILKTKIKYDIYILYCDESTDFDKYLFKDHYNVIFITNCIAVNHISECANLKYTKDIIYIKSETFEKKLLESILSIEWRKDE